MKTDSSAAHSIIASFISAMNNQDLPAFLGLFHPQAQVHDEGHLHTGPPEIQSWIEKAWVQAAPRLELLEVLATGEHTAFTARVSGTFPGSPIVLKHELHLAAEKIMRLKIAP